MSLYCPLCLVKVRRWTRWRHRHPFASPGQRPELLTGEQLAGGLDRLWDELQRETQAAHDLVRREKIVAPRWGVHGNPSD